MNPYEEINKAILATPETNSEEQLYNDYRSLLTTPASSTQNNPSESKINRLESKKASLFGMNDADTFVLDSGETVRSAIGDAVELPHGSHPYDMYGGEGKYRKSPNSMTAQRELTARVLNKEFGLDLTADTVTEQDMIDVANREQIQMLTDLAGEPQSQAPLIRGVEPTNLTGYYINDKGQTEKIPLGVDVGYTKTGEIGTAKDNRTLGFLQDASGREAVLNAALDPDRNAAYKWNQKNLDALGLKLEGAPETRTSGEPTVAEIMAKRELERRSGIDYEAGQTLAAAGAGLVKGAVELVDVAQELATWAPQEVYNKITGKNVDIDLIPTEFKKSLREGIDVKFGYDAEEDEKTVKDVKKLVEETGVNLFDPDTWGKVKDKENQKLLMKAVGLAATNPSLIAGMFTEIMGSGLALGTGIKVAGKIGSKLMPKVTAAMDDVLANSATKINRSMNAVKKSDTMTPDQKVKNLARLENIYTTDKKILDVLKGSIMTNADMAVRMNQWNEEYIKNNNGESPSVGKLLQMGVMARVASAAEVGSMKLSFGVKDGIKQLTEESKKGLWNGLVKAGKHFGTAVTSEGLQETFDGIVETIATQEGASKYEGKTVRELLEAEGAEILTGTILGAAGGGMASSPKIAYDTAKPAISYLDEKLRTKLDTPIDPTAAYRPETFEERLKVWDSVESEEFAVDTTPEARSAQTETVAAFAASLMNDKNFLKYNKDRADEGIPREKRIVLEQAANKIAKINGLDNKIQQDAIKYFTATKMVNYAYGKGAGTGLDNVDKSTLDAVLKETGAWIKGSAPAEMGMLEAQKANLQRLFTSKTINRKKEAAEFSKKHGLENVPDGPFLASLMTLTDAEYTELMDTVRDMRVLGSSNMKIVEASEAIEKSAKALREFGKKLGSGEIKGPDLIDGTGPMQKTYQDVSNEVDNIGFIDPESKSNRPGIKGHMNAITAMVGVPGLEDVANSVINSLGIFVSNRGIDKIHGLAKKSAKDTAVRLNRIGGIRTILTVKEGENNRILDVIGEGLKRAPEGTKQYADLVELWNTMQDHQADTVRLLQMSESTDPEVQKQVYRELADTTTIQNSGLLEELLAGDSWKSGYKIDSNIDTRPADMVNLELSSKAVDGSTKYAETEQGEGKSDYAKAQDGEIAPKAETKTAVEKVKKIIKEKAGKPEELTKEEEQLLANAAEDGVLQQANKELAEEVKETTKRATKEPADEGKSEYAKVKEGEQEPKTKEQYAEEVSKDIKTALKYSEKLAAEIAQVEKAIKEKKTKYREVRDLQLDVLKNLKPAKEKLDKTVQKLKNAQIAMKDSKRARGLHSVIQQFIKDLKNTITALKGWVTRFTKKVEELEGKRAEYSAEIKEIGSELDGLRAQLGMAKRAKAVVDTAIAEKPRQEIEEVLGKLVKANKSKKRSLLARIYTANQEGLGEDAKINSIMEILPAVAKNSEDGGRELVERALNLLNEYAADRGEYIPQQVGENNPLVNLQISEDTITFADLWNPVGKQDTAKEFKEKTDAVKRTRKRVKDAMNLVGVVTLKNMLGLKNMPSDYKHKAIESAFPGLIAQAKSEEEKMTITKKLFQAIQRNGLVPEAVFKREAGRFLLEQLEIKLSTDLTITQENNLIDALGVLVINNMLPAQGRDASIKISRSTAQMQNGKLKIGKIDEKEAAKYSAGVRLIDLSQVTPKYRREINAAAKAFEYASEKAKREVSDKIVLASEKVRNSYLENAPETKKYLDNQGSIEWKFDDSFVKHIEDTKKMVELAKENEEFADMADTEILTELVANAILGTEEDLLNNTPSMQFESKFAKYEAEKRTIGDMLDTYESVGTNGFYIGWATTTSMRSMMTSNMLNMQSSGISRFVVKTKDLENNIDTAKIKQKELEHIELAMAQALGLDIDKELAEDVLKEFHEKYVKIEKVKGGLTLTWGTNKVLKKLVEDGKFNLFNVLQENMTENEDPLQVDSKSIMHAVQAVDLLRDIKNSEGKKTELRTNLAIEADGITNGMMLVLMQMGLNDYTTGMLSKGGIFGADNEYKSHQEFLKGKGSTDVYKTPVKGLQIRLGDSVELLETAIGGKWRNFLKEGVMTFIYGSGIKTIRRNAAIALVEGNGYIDGAIGDEKKLTALLELAGMEENWIDTNVEYKGWIKGETGQYLLVDTDVKDPKNAYLSESAIYEIAAAIDEKIGDAIENTFAEEFGQIIDYRRAIKTVEEVNYLLYEAMLQEKIKDKLAARGVAKKDPVVSDLTREELLELQKEMVREDTSYTAKGPIEGSNVDYFNTERVQNGEMVSVMINTADYQSGSGFARNFATEVVDTIANIGAVGVTTVHNLDGSIMVKGHKQAVLNIYDALMLGSNYDKNVEQIQALNKAFAEVSLEHSMLGTAIEKMLRIANPENLDKVSEKSKLKILDNMKRIFEDQKVELNEAKAAEVLATIQQVHKSRENFAGQEMTFNQYAASDDVPGVKRKITAEEIAPTIPGEFEENSARIGEILNWLMKSAIEVNPPKAYTKGKSAKIDPTKAMEAINEVLNKMPPKLKKAMEKVLNNPENKIEEC